MHDFPSRTDPGFIVAFLISSMMGIVLTYAQINCTYVNDPTVTSVCGFFKDSFMIVLGLFLFGDVSFTPKLGFGLLAVISGGAWYTYNTVLERKAAVRVNFSFSWYCMTEYSSILCRSCSFIYFHSIM